jgi:hypothetical protein
MVSYPPPTPKGQQFAVGLFSCLFPACWRVFAGRSGLPPASRTTVSERSLSTLENEGHEEEQIDRGTDHRLPQGKLKPVLASARRVATVGSVTRCATGGAPSSAACWSCRASVLPASGRRCNGRTWSTRCRAWTLPWTLESRVSTSRGLWTAQLCFAVTLGLLTRTTPRTSPTGRLAPAVKPTVSATS